MCAPSWFYLERIIQGCTVNKTLKKKQWRSFGFAKDHSSCWPTDGLSLRYNPPHTSQHSTIELWLHRPCWPTTVSLHFDDNDRDERHFSVDGTSATFLWRQWRTSCKSCKQNQLCAQIFLMCLLLFSTCFGQLCAHHQEKIPYLCDTWY